MLQRTSKISLLLFSGWLLAGPLALLQLGAWGWMLASYTQESSFEQAIIETFGDERPCDLCRVIDSVEDTQSSNTAKRSVNKDIKLMLGLIYAPTDKLTLMLMANYIETEMEQRVRVLVPLVAAIGDDQFTTRSSGLGNIKLSALYRFYLKDNRKAHFGLGLSLPTGSIDEKDRTPKPPASMGAMATSWRLTPRWPSVGQRRFSETTVACDLGRA